MKPRIHILFEQNRLNSRPEMRVALGYDMKKSEWKFLGWVCPTCQQGLKTEYVAKKHRCSPQKLRRGSSDDFLDNAEIKTLSGQPFKTIRA